MRDVTIEITLQDVPDEVTLDEIMHSFENITLPFLDISVMPIVEHIEED